MGISNIQIPKTSKKTFTPSKFLQAKKERRSELERRFVVPKTLDLTFQMQPLDYPLIAGSVVAHGVVAAVKAEALERITPVLSTQ